MNITLVYSPAPRQVREWSVQLPEASTITDAIAASSLAAEFPELNLRKLVSGVWGHKTQLSQVLQDMDRIEIYRGLRVDPKVARRERFNSQGVKRAGLFAKTRAGAKAGY